MYAGKVDEGRGSVKLTNSNFNTLVPVFGESHEQALPYMADLIGNFNTDVKNQVLEERDQVSSLNTAMEIPEQEDQDRHDEDGSSSSRTTPVTALFSEVRKGYTGNITVKNQPKVITGGDSKGKIRIQMQIKTKNKTKTNTKTKINIKTKVLGGGSMKAKARTSKCNLSYNKILYCRQKKKMTGTATSRMGTPSPSNGGEEKTIPDAEEEDNFSHSKLDGKNLAWYHANMGGWASKRHVLSNIICSSEFDVLAITETHTSTNKMSIPGFKFFSRSRSVGSNSKGGVALGIRDELKEYAVKVFEGEGSNEVLMVKLTCFKPAVVFGVAYGNQEGTTPPDVIRNNIKNTMTAIERFQDQGLKVVLVGDLNLHVGAAVEGNDDRVSKGGEYLIDLCNELDLEIANNRATQQSHTHFDRTSKTSRVLDLVITNAGDDMREVRIDVDKQVTPYRLKADRNGVTERKYTDHLALYGEISVNLKERKRRSKTKIWNLRKKGAKLLFQYTTNMKAGLARKIVLEAKNCTEMLQMIEKLLLQAKREAFEVRTVTRRKLERETDERLSMKRVKELQEISEEMSDFRLRIPDKVFLSRKKLMKEEEELIEALDHYKTGERLETPEEIYDSVMDYNVEVLTKNPCEDEWSRERMEEKSAAVEFFEKVETDESERDIQWDEWEKVMVKITELNKSCYRDLVWAGHEWQAAMYMMFKRIYREEDIPQKFLKTSLKRLYKRKGDKTKLSSYRFIHLKEWAAKVMEKLVMQKCNDLIAGVMPQGQIGGMKKSSTSEHISSLHALARMKMKEKSGIIIMFVDVMKCFDKQRLNDTMYSAAVAGLKGKGLRMIRKLHDNTEISLVGDPTGRVETITNSTGQGTNWAPLACSLSMGKAFKAADDAYPEGKMKVDGLEIPLMQFVDDTIKACETAEQARIGGKVFTRALNELGLKAHPDKSAMVIVGGKQYREKIKKELEKNPVYVQKFKMQISECETYLGAEISEKGPRESVNKSLRKRIKAAMGKEFQLSKMLESDQMDKAGWLDAAKTLANSIISPTLTYAAQSYAFMSKNQIDEVEGAFKEILYRMLKLSKYTQYAAVLLECNMIKVKHIINQLKIGFIKDLIHSKGYGPCLDIHMKEEQLYPGTGLIAEVRKLCGDYRLPDATKENIGKELIRDRIWEIGRVEIWKDTVKNKRVPFNRTHVRFLKQYMALDRYKSRLFFAYRTGELQFKEYRRGEFGKRFGNTKCFMNGCNEPDNLEHVMKCDRYPDELRFHYNNYNYDPDEQREFIEYLQKLDVYRGRQFDLPVLYRPSLRKQIERRLGLS